MRRFASPSATMSVLLAFGSLVALGGCSSGYTVTGSVTFPKNVEPAATEPVQINFIPGGDGQKPAAALFNRTDNTFVCNGLSPGKYKITVSVTPPISLKGEPTKRQIEAAKLNKTFSPQDTKLAYDVTTDSDQSITIDLTKGTVTKK